MDVWQEVNRDRAELGLGGLIRNLPQLDPAFLSRKAKAQSRNVEGEFVPEIARLDLPSSSGRAPARAYTGESAHSEAGQHLLATVTSKSDPTPAGPDWTAETIGSGVSVPYLWTNKVTGEKFVVKDNGGEKRNLGPLSIHNEQAAYSLMGAMGSSAPVAEQNGRVSVVEWAGAHDDIDHSSLKEFFKIGSRRGDPQRARLASEMADPDEILRIALSDVAMVNGDRHMSNVLIADGNDGKKRVYPLDHNIIMDFADQEEEFDQGDWERFIFGPWGMEMVPQYVALMRDQTPTTLSTYQREVALRRALTDKVTAMREEALANLSDAPPGQLAKMRENLLRLEVERFVDYLLGKR